MFIKDLMNYLEHFIDGKKGDSTVRVVFKPNKRQILRAPDIPE
jgi:hypothetical protein